MKKYIHIRYILVLSLTVLMAACVAPEPMPVISIPPPSPEETEKAKEIWKKAEERNATIENTAEWINDSYNSLKIRPLATLPTYKYPEYKKFLDDGAVYIINHPGFYTFFQHPKIARKDNTEPGNIMDLFLNKHADAPDTGSKSKRNQKIIDVMREFERIETNFIEYKSTEHKLIIIILPGNYRKYAIFSYRNLPDEYMRFINDVTNMSESVLYLESKKPNRGQLNDEDINALTDFLQKIGATSVMLGGEYIGRCQEDFYKQLSDALGGTITVEIVPELSPVSPDDMNSGIKDLLDSNNKLDVRAATFNIMKDTYNKIESAPKLRNLKSRLFYEKPEGN